MWHTQKDVPTWNKCACVCTKPEIQRQKSAVGLPGTAIQKRLYTRKEGGFVPLGKWLKDHSADTSKWGTEIAVVL